MKTKSFLKIIFLFLGLFLVNFAKGQEDVSLNFVEKNFYFGTYSTWNEILSKIEVKDSYDAVLSSEKFNLSIVSVRNKNTNEVIDFSIDFPSIGDYSISVKFTPIAEYSGNYSSKTTTFSITIKKSQKVLSSNDIEANGFDVLKTKIYDGTNTTSVVENGNVFVSGININLNIKDVSAFYEDKNVGIGKKIFVHFVVDDDNYEYESEITQEICVDGEIKAKEISLVGGLTIEKNYNCELDAPFTGTPILSGVIDGDDVKIEDLVLNFINPNVVDNGQINIKSYSFSGQDKDNYKLTSTNLTGKITCATPTIELGKTEYTYGDCLAFENITINNTFGDDLKNLNKDFNIYYSLFYGDGYGPDESKPAITQNSILEIGENDKKYKYDIFIEYLPNSGNYCFVGSNREITVSPKPVTLTVSYDEEKTYDATTTVNNLTISPSEAEFKVFDDDKVYLPTSANYADANVNPDENSNPKNKTITIGEITGDDKYKYAFTYADEPYTGIINKLTLEFTCDVEKNVVYGETSKISNVVTNLKISNIPSAETLAESEICSYEYKIDGNVYSENDVIPVTAKTLSITAISKNGNYSNSDPKEISINVAPITLNYTIDNSKISKVYDGSTDVEIESGKIIPTNIFNGENVSIKIDNANFDSKNVGDNKKITATFSLDGEDKNNYQLAETAITFCDDCGEITKKDINFSYVFNVSEKYYNGKTNADENQVITFIPTLDGVVDGDKIDVNLDKETIEYDSPEVGEERNITADVVFTGDVIENYNIASPQQIFTTGKISPAKPYFIVDETHFVYGESKIDENFVVKISNGDNDNVSCDVLDIEDFEFKNNLPAGEHQIKVVYKPQDGENYSENDTIINVTVDKRQLFSTENVEKYFTTTRVYNGKDLCSLNVFPNIEAITPIYQHWNPTYKRYDNDQVAIADMVGHFDTPEIGMNKPITITFTIIGSESDNYIAPQPYIYPNGIILPGEIVAEYNFSNNELDAQNAEICDDEIDKLTLNISVTSGFPQTYEIVFDQKSINAGFVNVPEKDIPEENKNVTEYELEIYSELLPNGVEYGDFGGSIFLYNNTTKAQLELPFSITLRHGMPQPKFSDVVFIDNGDHNFTAYQWYKNDEKIEGATLQFYNDLGGFSHNKYYAMLTTVNGDVYKSCEFDGDNAKISSTSKKASTVNVYPNPTQANKNFYIKLNNFDVQQINNSEIYIYNNAGILVKKLKVDDGVVETSLPQGQYSGVYVIDNQKISFKIIVK